MLKNEHFFVNYSQKQKLWDIKTVKESISVIGFDFFLIYIKKGNDFKSFGINTAESRKGIQYK